MIGINVKIEDTTKAVEKAVDKAAFKNFGHAANRIMKDAQASILKAPKQQTTKQNKSKRDARGRFLKGSGKKRRRTRTVPSQPGTPPHTRSNQIKRAIKYSANKEGAVIGPEFSKMGTAAEPHEFGGKYKGDTFPDRPFMGPALERNQARFASDWQNSVY